MNDEIREATSIVLQVRRLCWNKGLDVTASAWSENGAYLVTAHAASNGALFMYKVAIVSISKQMCQCTEDI